LFFVDSDRWDSRLYGRISQRIGGEVDVIFLGMECSGAPLTWLYDPLPNMPISRRNDESRRLSAANAERTWSVLASIHARRVSVYAMGQEPWLKYIMDLHYPSDAIPLKEVTKFLERCSAYGIAGTKLEGSRDIFV